MHGRTKEQKYKGQANWDALAELKTADIDAMLNYTGCDAVMIGRGAIGNPWIFGRQERYQRSFSLLLAIVAERTKRSNAEQNFIVLKASPNFS
jgi:tRNA-dihydrouridine synthase